MSALIHKLLKCRCTHLQITSDSDDGGTCTGGKAGGGGGEGGHGQSTPKPLYTASYSGTLI